MDDYRKNKTLIIAADVPDTHEGVVEFIKRELDCPLPIREGEPFDDLKYKLLGLWKEIVRNHSIDIEWHHIYDDDDYRDFELDEDSFEELHPLAVNIQTWINEARAKFLAKVRPITPTVADATIYPKHILKKNISVDEIKKVAVKEDASYLFNEITPNVISKIIHKSAITLFEPIVNLEKIRFSVSCSKEIGVTNTGQITNYLMVEIDCIQAIAHAYPCSIQEAKNNVATYPMKSAAKYDYYYLDEEEDPDLELNLLLTTSIVLE